MADTTYVDYVAPAVNAEWLNEINDHVWHDTSVSGTTVHGSDVIEFTPSGVGGVARTAQAKMRETVSVTDFGAVGDGDNTGAGTDDTQAFIDAFASGAQNIYVPPGVYIINPDQITLPDTSWTLYGPADGLSARLQQKVGTTSGYLLSAVSASGPPKMIVGLGFNGIESPSATKLVSGVKLGNTNGLYLENCWGRALGKWIGSSTTSTPSSLISVRSCTVESCVDAIDIVRGDECIFSDLVFYGNELDISIAARADAAEADLTGNGTVISNISTARTLRPITLNGCRNTVVSNVSAEYLSVGYAVSNAYAVKLTSCEDVSLSNVSIRGDTTYKAAGAVSASGSRITGSNLSAKNCAYVLNITADYSTFSNIYGKTITNYGVYGQGSTDSVYENIDIDGCVNGFYASVCSRSRIRDMRVINNSGEPFANAGTTYISIDESLVHNVRAEITNGLRVFNILGDNRCVTYRTAAPTDIINPLDTANRLGSIAYNIAPTAGGFMGWVCTTEGNGATSVWKTFGAISA